MTKIINIEKIIEMMPHRYPFLLIDRLIDIQNEIESGRAKNDYEALKYLQEDSYIEYNNILKLGGNKRFSLNFSDYNN